MWIHEAWSHLLKPDQAAPHFLLVRPRSGATVSDAISSALQSAIVLCVTRRSEGHERLQGLEAFAECIRLFIVEAGMTNFGIIGAGHIGGALARTLIDHGYTVTIANSRGPETLADLVGELGPNAVAATAEDTARAGDVVVVTVPLKSYRDIPVEPLAGKIVIDTNNYYWERDGRIPELDEGVATVSGLLQEHLPASRIVKAFNHIRAADILTDGTAAGTARRRALATASDFPDASALVIALYDEFGFDAVDIGTLSESWRVERDRPAYVVPQTRAELEANLARAPRTLEA
ncbi:hypothetical protein BH09ACT6_BH09ACT6_15950 [soil metagenome]